MSITAAPAVTSIGRGAARLGEKARHARFFLEMLLARPGARAADAARVAYLDLANLEGAPENWSGRLTWALLYLLHGAGYRISLRSRPGLLRSLRTEKYARLAMQFSPRIGLRAGGLGKQAIYIHDGQPSRRIGAAKALRLEYDPASWNGEPEGNLAVPFLMHPRMYDSEIDRRLESLRQSERRMRLFFAGRVSELYDDAQFTGRFGKLTRCTILSHLAQELPDRLLSLQDQSALESLLAGSDERVRGLSRFVWFGAGETRIHRTQWLATLARCEFFLGCPGVTKPMAHNVVEAMAVGAVPLLEYPEYFHPPLRHMENCIVFGGPDDLVAKVRALLEMDQETITRLRSGAVAYFENHLTPRAFGARLAKAPAGAVLHLMAQNAPDPHLP